MYMSMNINNNSKFISYIQYLIIIICIVFHTNSKLAKARGFEKLGFTVELGYKELLRTDKSGFSYIQVSFSRAFVYK